MKKMIVVLAMLLLAGVAVAEDFSFTVKVGRNYGYGDLCFERLGPVQGGVAVDYFHRASNVNLDDIGIGPVVKLHALPKGSDFTLCAEYVPMFQASRLKRSASEIIGGTAAYKGFGVSYQYLLDSHKTGPTPMRDRWLFSWTKLF